jgi:hypothetical protein
MTTHMRSNPRRRWWWMSAMGAGAASAMFAILLVPASASSVPQSEPRQGPSVGRTTVDQPRSRLNCPPPPDPRFIGGPWVPAEPTGCQSLDRWWLYVDTGRS